MKKWDVYVYGDVNVDLILPGVEKIPPKGEEWEITVMKTLPGGGAALFALGLGKLGLHPVFKGKVGDDCYGQFLLDELRKRGIDVSLLKKEKGAETGISLSFTNEKDRSFLTLRGTNAELDISNIRVEEVAQARHIHVTGYGGTKNHDSYYALLKKIKDETQATVSFDVGWDSSGEWNQKICELFPYIDVLFMNETESVHYSRKNSAREAALDFSESCKLAVIKLGKKGSLAAAGKEIFEEASYPVRAVDTTGAGDSFNAGFIYGYLKGAALSECLRFGNGCGALSCTGLGGNTAFPEEEGLLAFLKKNRNANLG